MIALSPQMRCFVCTQCVDLRKGMDALAAVCRDRFNKDPMDGSVYIFFNRLRTHIRILVYDGQGFWLCTKRMSQGKFAQYSPTDAELLKIAAHELHILIRGGNPRNHRGPGDWRAIS